MAATGYTKGNETFFIPMNDKNNCVVNYSATTITNNSNSLNYIQVVSNSHFWSDLESLLVYLGYIQDSGNQFYTAWGAEVEQLIIGLENTIKNGYNIKKVSGIVNLEPYFESIEEMINYFPKVDISPSCNPNELLRYFIKKIRNTIGMGYNLTNGLKMERKDVYKLIDDERNYQDKNWGARRTADGTPDEEKPVAEWINYMEFHISKAKERVYHLDTQGALAEVRKIAALAVRTMEIHGAPERIANNDCCGGKKSEKVNCCSKDNDSCDCKYKKMIFKIKVNDIPEDEIEDYIRKIAEKIKTATSDFKVPPDFKLSDFDEDIYYPPKDNINDCSGGKKTKTDNCCSKDNCCDCK